MDSIRPYLDWQTTIEYLKDPPAEYAEKIQPPYDFYANYERIYQKAAGKSTRPSALYWTHRDPTVRGSYSGVAHPV